VSVIATATNTLNATIPVGGGPFGVAVSPDGSKVYVANTVSNNVSVIATATNMVAKAHSSSPPSEMNVTRHLRKCVLSTGAAIRSILA
jgi:DNA-binding beta-propeller fold protein YncE